MKDLKNSMFVIFSAYLSEMTEEQNDRRHEIAKEILTNLDIEFVECLGAYNGIEEKSILVYIDTPALYLQQVMIDKIKNIAFSIYNQESILVQGNDGIGKIIYNSKIAHRIGKYTEIPISQKANFQAYTQVNNKTFIYS